MKKFNITVNRKTYSIDAEPDVPLVWIIRDYVGLKGTKFGCGIGSCGACTVHLNGAPIRSCQLRIANVPAGAAITTIEGIGQQSLHVVQQVWTEMLVPQCGYCQSGQIMSAIALLAKKPKPSDKDIDAAMAGNLCRCGTYDRVRKAIHRAAEKQSQVQTGSK